MSFRPSSSYGVYIFCLEVVDDGLKYTLRGSCKCMYIYMCVCHFMMIFDLVEFYERGSRIGGCCNRLAKACMHAWMAKCLFTSHLACLNRSYIAQSRGGRDMGGNLFLSSNG